MKGGILKTICLFLMAPMTVSCIFDNDMSYPYIKGEIMSFAVDGQKSVTIDAKKRTVSVELLETADISRVKVTEVRLNDDASFAEELPEYLDLSEPYRTVVRTYQDYVWKIIATQPVERYVTCAGSSKNPLFSAENRTVLMYLLPSQELTSVVIDEMKLEKEGSEIIATTGYELREIDGEVIPVKFTKPLSGKDFPVTLDCTLERGFTVLCDGKEIEWKLSAVRQRGELKVHSVAPWCWSADVTAEFEGDGEPYLMYRRTDTAEDVPVGTAGEGGEGSDDGAAGDEWIEVRDVTVKGVSVSAKLSGLAEGADYVIKIIAGGAESEEFVFSTCLPEQLDNMGFDDWFTNDKGTWYPGLDIDTKIWDTANGGAALLKKNPTVPEYSLLAPSESENKAAARLESMTVGMFAAGNIYTGKFIKASLAGNIGAVLEWGAPFTSRPKALKGYYSYSPKTITSVKAPYEDLKGTMDKCQLLVILTDWEEPFTVDTSKGIFVDQDNDPNIIAYAKYESDRQTSGYEPFELELDYRRPDAVPTYAVVIACASYKGDFFTGGVGSVMYVDEFEFVYE